MKFFAGLILTSALSWFGTARCLHGAEAQQSVSAHPNVVMIVSDDQAWTDYSFMGHPHIRTPHLDRLAEQSLTFRRGYVTSSVCCPSLASIITGLYPHQHKITSNDPPRPAGLTPAAARKTETYRDLRRQMVGFIDEVPTLPRVLGEQGYLSFQTGKWWQGHYSHGGFTHGMSHGDTSKGGRHGDAGLQIGRQTMQPIFDFISHSQQEKKPFFVWYAPMMPHDPHTPPERLLAKYRDKTPSIHVARYWAMCEWFDETCGELLAHLDEKGLAENTIVVYVTDNGWIQSTDNRRFAPKSKLSPYDGGLRTPIMVRWPGKIQPRQSEELASAIDIVPTLLAALDIPATPEMQGLNLLDHKAISQRQTIFGECFTHDAVDIHKPATSLTWRWVVDGQWKLILPAPQNVLDGQIELYHVAEDPHEEQNLAAEQPQRVQALTKKLNTWWKAEL